MAEQIITKRDEVKGLLRKLFRSDQADLDFGIYRIMNFKRAQIEDFIEKRLIEIAESEFKDYLLASSADLERELEEDRKKIEGLLGSSVFNATGDPVKYLDVKAVQEYEEKRKALREAALTEEQVNDVFSHVYEFFSRYYEDGDFIPKTRYGGRDKYYVPYNGEEVVLHWATKDMYYVKTGEYFKKYSFKAGRFTVTFRLVEAEVETGNVKGEKKFFMLSEENPVQLDEVNSSVEIRLNYRGLSEEEKRKHGTRNVQSALVTEALERIRSSFESSSIAGILRPKAGEDRSLMEKHMNTYVDRNTKDFFIHKDLKGFLKRELDFYLKNEVWNLNELDTLSQGSAKTISAKVKAIRNVALKIIEFLNQIESFQKQLFEKKKFVLRTDYCITLDLIPEEFYEEIGKNERQIAEWRALYKLDEITGGTLHSTVGKTSLSPDFLKLYKYMMIDTKLFTSIFKDELLDKIDDIEDKVCGLLIKSENYQALELLKGRYHEKVKCIYIDPPYNTGSDDFLYKDNYFHSSWSTMMENRLRLSGELLQKDGIIVSHIDENELNMLYQLYNDIFGEVNYIGTVIWDKRNPKGDARQIASQHEYLIYISKDNSETLRTTQFLRQKRNTEFILAKAKQIYNKIDRELIPDEISKYAKLYGYSNYILERLRVKYTPEVAQREFETWMSLQNFSGGEKAYNILDQDGRVFRGVSMAWPNTVAPKEYHYTINHPKTGKPCPNPAKGWRCKNETMQDLLKKGDILFGLDETTQPQRKYYLDEFKTENYPSIIYFGGDASTELSHLGLEFPTAKPLVVSEQIIAPITSSNDIIIDYFAGSGTLAHLLVNLNRFDQGQRRYILVDYENHLESIAKKRIQKVVFSKEWKNGNPLNMDGVSHCFKYHVIEQFEDALNNIEFRSPEGGIQKSLDRFQDYFLTYILEYETRDSPTRLSTDKFKTPFNYRIKTLSAGEEREELVDLVETFNYFLGLRVNKIRAHRDGDRIYRTVFGERDHEQVAVIWRDTPGLDLERDKHFIENTILVGSTPDTIFVNGDSYVRNARPIEPEFRRLMGA